MPKPTTFKPGPGISRIDHEGSRTFGFFVRLGYRRTARGTRPTFTAFFGDVSHGGKRAALRAAVSWAKTKRKELEALLKRRAGRRTRRA